MIRLRVPDTPVFEDMRAARARTKVPALAMIRAMPKRFVLVMATNLASRSHLRCHGLATPTWTR